MEKSRKILALALVVGLVSGFGGAALWSWSGLGDKATRSYLMAHPEILPEMMEELQAREARNRLKGIGADVKTPFPGAVLGNPKGSKVLVEFSDYGCGFCRQSVPEIEAMIAADPELKVVIRELPIFDGSETSARMALAAAEQGKFAEFHHAMFAAEDTGEATVNAVAEKIGLDMPKAKATANSEKVTFELGKNHQFAQQLGIQGTPSWVAGDNMIYGAVGRAQLNQALNSAAE